MHANIHLTLIFQWLFLKIEELKYTETVIRVGVKLGLLSKGMGFATDLNADADIWREQEETEEITL